MYPRSGLNCCASGYGGALVSPETYQSESKKMVGSGMIFEAENIDVVRKLIHEDIYYTSGVVRAAFVRVLNRSDCAISGTKRT